MRIVATSDTHFVFTPDRIPDGDVFVLAGDFMYYGSPDEWRSRLDSIAALPHKHKLIVPGNHDYYCQHYRGIARSSLRREAKATLLDDLAPEITIDSVRFLGVPFVEGLPGWAYNVEPEWLLNWTYEFRTPDIMISHSPPYNILDAAGPKQNYGSLALNRFVYRREEMPKHWFCGHVHESYGSTLINDCAFHNVAMCDADYQQVNAPTVIDL